MRRPFGAGGNSLGARVYQGLPALAIFGRPFGAKTKGPEGAGRNCLILPLRPGGYKAPRPVRIPRAFLTGRPADGY
jgi:hypothetical protein